MSTRTDVSTVDLAAALSVRSCSCSELATALRRRKADVLAALRAHPETFAHNGYRGRHSKWTLRYARNAPGNS